MYHSKKLSDQDITIKYIFDHYQEIGVMKPCFYETKYSFSKLKKLNFSVLYTFYRRRIRTFLAPDYPRNILKKIQSKKYATR